MVKLYEHIARLPFVSPSWRKVEHGWDPVTRDYAADYAAWEWQQRQGIETVCAKIEGRMGGLAGKRILDLGAGPGQYTIAFAERGADVTWHDPSRNYLLIAQRKAADRNVRCTWSLGYMEEAGRLRERPFDLLFNRICWYYCASDRRFAALVIHLLKPGGSAWLDIPTADGARSRSAYAHWAIRAQFAFYGLTGIKLRHFMPERGKILSLLARNPSVARIEADYSKPGSERIWLTTHPKKEL